MKIKKYFKNLVVFATVISFFMFYIKSPVFSHSGEQGNVKVDDIVAEILQKQGVNDLKDINCEKVSEDDLERLGEAVMSYMVPDDRQHRAMDDMMGGEGSESLRQAHITMGSRFLGCSNVPGFMGMMGPGMMMGSDFWKGGFGKFGDYKKEGGWSGMMPGFGMGGYGLFWIFKSFAFITWLAFLAFLILGSIYFWKGIKRKK